MKTIISISICIILFSCSNNNPSPSNPPNPITHSDTLTTGWALDSIPGGPGLYDIYFANNTIGYALQNTRLYKSTDGGNAWTSVFNFSHVENIASTADGKVFLAADNATLYYSTDNGFSFDSAKFGGTQKMKEVYFLDNDHGFVVGDTLYATANGGTTWQKVNPMIGVSTFLGSPYETMSFVNQNIGWIVDRTGCYHTNNELINDWVSIPLSTFSDSHDLSSCYAVDANTIFVTTLSGEVYKSIDGGLHFSSLIKFINGDYSDVHFIDSNEGYVCYGTRIYKTVDGGANWQTVVALGSKKLIEIHFTDANHGWACGDDGTVLIYHP